MENKHPGPLAWINELTTVFDNIHAGIDHKNVSLEDAFDELARRFKTVRANKKTVWWAGNGGSAAVCAHLAQDLMNKTGIRSIHMGQTPLITCMANDFGYGQVYAKPLGILCDPGDLLIAISSSGNSENILNAVHTAKDNNVERVLLSGFDENNGLNRMREGLRFHVPSHVYGIVELTHEAIIHSVVETLTTEKAAE
ncbi:MAG: SIS domain-containing protein [Desulfobacter sp.]